MSVNNNCRVNGCNTWYSDLGQDAANADFAKVDKLCGVHFTQFGATQLAKTARDAFKLRVSSQKPPSLYYQMHSYQQLIAMYSSPEWLIALDQWLETL